MVHLPAIIEQHKPDLGQSIRVDCPYCGGENTLSITNNGTTILWNCFRSSCVAKGNTEASYSKEAVQILFEKLKKDEQEDTQNKELEIKPFILPKSFKLVYDHQDSMEMMRKYSLFLGQSKGLYNIQYDPILHRLVFIIKYDDIIVNAVGRSLHSPKAMEGLLNTIGFKSKNTTSKWFVYGPNTHIPFYAGKSDKIVIVEDAISAACVAQTEEYSGCAILGTEISAENINFLLTRSPSEVIIALDKDASAKGIEYVRELSPYFKKISMLGLSIDLKYYKYPEIRDILNKRDNSSLIRITNDRKEIVTNSTKH